MVATKKASIPYYYAIKMPDCEKPGRKTSGAGLVITYGHFQLSEGLLELCVIRGNSMPFVASLHKVDPLAHNRIHDIEHWFFPPCQGLCVFQRLDGFGQVIAVEFLNIPAKGLILLAQVAQVENLLGGSVDLLPVMVYCGDEVVHLVVGGIGGRFPNLALILLAVAHKNKDKSVVPA